MDARQIDRKWKKVELDNLKKNLSVSENPESVEKRIFELEKILSKPLGPVKPKILKSIPKLDKNA